MQPDVVHPSLPRLGVGGGSLKLRLSAGDATYEMESHWTFDTLREVVACVSALAGTESFYASSCWGYEDRGYILDFGAWQAGPYLSVAVHRLPEPAETRSHPFFSAVRGELEFEGVYERRNFLVTWVVQLWSLYVLKADQFGFMVDYNRIFPKVEFDGLYAAVRRQYGLNLPPPQEVRDRGVEHYQ